MNRRACWWLATQIVLSVFLLTAPCATADVRLPAVFSDNMVLQRGMSVPVWGWADPNERITVQFQDQTKATTAEDSSGKWMVRLDSMEAGGPFVLNVRGKNSVEFKNVMVGEVWLCSGQSNMQWTVASSNNAQQEIAAARFPGIRLITVPRVGTQEPQRDFQGEWVECSPETVGEFSAVGYFFGRELYQELGIPIGLIHCSWGGSACEAWVKRSLLEGDPQYKPLLDRWDQIAATYDPEKAQAAYQKQLDRWKQLAAQAKKEGKPRPNPPRAPADPLTGQHRPANLYNGMLLPLMPYAMRGAIWYQGESNASLAYQYRSLFPLMIRNWRNDWQQGDFPFYFVQLANYMAVQPDPADSAWAELREAQLMTLSVPNTGMAVIIDIGEEKDIHPKNKQDVGKRLAQWALVEDYGRECVYSGPLYKSMSRQGSEIALKFDHIDGGLEAVGGGPLSGFAIAGADRKFVWADARIEGEQVVVSSSQVAEPVAVRYAWADNPVCNLGNKAGLPASPFRTDAWPGITANEK